MLATAVVIAFSVGTFLNLRGIFIIPGLVSIGTLYSYFAGYGICLIAIIAVGYFTTGVWGVLAYFAARVISFIAQQVLEFTDTESDIRCVGDGAYRR